MRKTTTKTPRRSAALKKAEARAAARKRTGIKRQQQYGSGPGR